MKKLICKVCGQTTVEIGHKGGMCDFCDAEYDENGEFLKDRETSEDKEDNNYLEGGQ